MSSASERNVPGTLARAARNLLAKRCGAAAGAVPRLPESRIVSPADTSVALGNLVLNPSE